MCVAAGTLSVHVHMSAYRLSLPPSLVYIPVEEVARCVKELGYQVYFADDSSTREIEGYVFILSAVLPIG